MPRNLCPFSARSQYHLFQQHTIPASTQNIHIQTQQKSERINDVRPGFCPEPGGNPPGLLPADKAGVLKVAEQVHHPDVVDILVHNQPTFQEEAAPNRQGAASSSYLLKSWISKKQSFCTCIRHYSPRWQGGSRRTVLTHITGISPLRGSLRAAPIACSRYHPGLWLDRSIITGLLTRVGLAETSCNAKQPATGCFVDGWAPLCTFLGRL